jgi:hypothetical protein
MRRPRIRYYLNRPAARGLTKKARDVYEVLLACCKDDESGDLNFGVVRDRYLMSETGWSESSICRARRELAETGLVLVVASGLGRAHTAYKLVLTPVGCELEAYAERAAEMADQVVVGGAVRTSCETTQSGLPDNSESSGLTPPYARAPQSFRDHLPLPVPGQGPSGQAAGLRPTANPSPGSAGATTCPTAAIRGKPCASCRACGTNPRALRQAAAKAQGLTRVADFMRNATPPDQRLEVNHRNLPTARAIADEIAARAAAKRKTSSEGRSAPGHDDEGRPPPGSSSAGGESAVGAVDHPESEGDLMDVETQQLSQPDPPV